MDDVIVNKIRIFLRNLYELHSPHAVLYITLLVLWSVGGLRTHLDIGTVINVISESLRLDQLYGRHPVM